MGLHLKSNITRQRMHWANPLQGRYADRNQGIDYYPSLGSARYHASEPRRRCIRFERVFPIFFTI